MNGKDVSNSSGISGTTGVFSNAKKKKNIVYIKNTYIIRECIYKGQFHNTYKASCLPKVLHTGEEKINGSTYFVKVTESYGPSIKILHSLMGNSFSLPTICIFAINMLNILEEIHKSNIIHRNIKPRKIVIHNDLKNTQLFLIDFKYARKYKHKNGQLVRYNENSRILNKVFCNKFSSIGTHLGICNIFGNRTFKSREEKLKYYEEWKLSFIPETLNQQMPQEFINYLNYTKSMNILDPPEYEVWKKAFKQLLSKLGVQSTDYIYEWIPKIKNEMIHQYGNSFLHDLDTPLTTPAVQKDASKLSQNGNESEDKGKGTTAITTSNNANPEETTNLTKDNQKQSQSTIASALPVPPPILNSIVETQESFAAGGGGGGGGGQSSYYYGAVEIDMTEQLAKQTVQSNMTFGADSEIRNNQIQQGNNGSIIDNFSTYNKKQQNNSSQHLQTSQYQVNTTINTSSYSTDDLSICDDETQNSLSSQLSRHNNNIQMHPFFFKFKQFD